MAISMCGDHSVHRFQDTGTSVLMRTNWQRAPDPPPILGEKVVADDVKGTDHGDVHDSDRRAR